jgi:hypothetical protein
MNWEEILKTIQADPRYVEGLTYGVPRQGHDEGSVANHLVELEENLNTIYNGHSTERTTTWEFECFKPLITDEEMWKLKTLIHVHDSFKLEGKRRTNFHKVSLRDPQSHASLARAFLSEFTDDESVLAIAQFHDEGHALWQQWREKGAYREERMRDCLQHIPDVTLYLIFTIIDGYTTSKIKDRSPRWFVEEVAKFAEVPRAFEVLTWMGI